MQMKKKGFISKNKSEIEKDTKYHKQAQLKNLALKSHLLRMLLFEGIYVKLQNGN